MNRRRFLKYAGAGVAVAGSALAGYEFDRWQNALVPPSIYTTTVTETRTLRETATETVRLASVHGRLFFDYNGNGVLDGEEPPVVGASVQLKDDAGSVIAEALSDSSGDYNLEDVRTGSYRMHVEADKKFRYICTSGDDLRAVTDDYELSLQGISKMDFGLMQGPLTIPLAREIKFEVSNLYDWDPRVGHVKWWNGTVLVPGDTTPVRYRTGFDNHSGIDYSVDVGSPIIAPAPGIVYAIPELGPQGQIATQMHHDSIDFWTGYNHISRITVASGQRVSRGQKIAESGKSGTDFPHLHFNTKQLDDDWTKQLESLRILDFYKPTFLLNEESSGYWNWRADIQDIVWKRCPKARNPGLLGYWTKENDPQFPV